MVDPESIEEYSIHILPDEVSQDTLNKLRNRLSRIKEHGLWQEELESLNPLHQILPVFARAVNRKLFLSVYGRVIEVQDFGKLIFAVIQQGTTTIELKLNPEICLTAFEIWKQYIELGDIIVARGQASYSRNKTPQINVYKLSFLSLCGLSPNSSGISKQAMPTNYREQRVHSQMIADPIKVTEFRVQSAIIKSIRDYLNEENFEEYITPMLMESFYGGGSHPFITYSRAEERDLYLRLTAEIAMKMLIVGGLSRTYEIGPSFRNENQDSQHLSGFLLLEAYAAYVPFDQMIRITERMINRVISNIQRTWGELGFSGLSKNSFSKDFSRISAKDALIDVLGIDIRTRKGLDKLARSLNKGLPQNQTEKANLVYHALKEFVYPNLNQPSFLLDLPAGASPFIQANPQQENILQRAFLVLNGVKIAEVFFSELNAIEIQKAIEQQKKHWRTMSIPAQRDYRDFLHAMLCGLPPVSVMDVGIERFMMLILGKEDVRKVKLRI